MTAMMMGKYGAISMSHSIANRDFTGFCVVPVSC
jgi:hypothetical protein